MEIAESIVETLKKSNKTVPSKYTISTRGPKQIINPKRDIGVFYDNDKLNMQTFDSDDRFENFMLLITFKKMSYTEAQEVIWLKDIQSCFVCKAGSTPTEGSIMCSSMGWI